jgi:hypothetical protein
MEKIIFKEIFVIKQCNMPVTCTLTSEQSELLIIEEGTCVYHYLIFIIK